MNACLSLFIDYKPTAERLLAGSEWLNLGMLIIEIEYHALEGKVVLS